jgi:integrase
MITEGSAALKMPWNPRQAEMEEYLSAEGGYWLENDIWRTDSGAYRSSGLRKSRRDGVLADFTGCRNASMKLELKYYILCSLKNQWKSPVYVQDMLVSVIRLAGQGIASTGIYSSFGETGQSITEELPKDTEPTVAALYRRFLKGIQAFFTDYYDGREETEKDVWQALKIPGVKLSAAMKRQHPGMNFMEIPEAYRGSVKRFLKRLVVRRSWSYCKEMLMYIRYFFEAFYANGYADGFLEKLSRQDVENYLRWVADSYDKKNATYRSKAVSFIRSWLDYIQIAEYPQAPRQGMERLIFDDDVPKRERAADTLEKVRYIPAPVIRQMDACMDQIEPAEMRPVYALLRETGWRGTDVLNLRYDNCLQYIWNARENRSVPYLCGEITKVGIPQMKDPIRDEVAEMVRLLADEAAAKSNRENNPDRYLFNCYEGKCMGLPFSKPAFSKAVQKMIEKNGIRDADGNLFHFKAHGLRHTRAMEYAEQGMPIGIIQRLLGHCSLQMSLHYAKVTEDTLYQKWKNTERLDLFKPSVLPPGRTAGQEDMVHYEKVRPGLDAVRVPFGVCFKPSKAGCRRQTEQCLECPSFCSTSENLDEYAAEIEKARSMIRIGQTLGREEWVKKNKEYLDRLIRMHDELDAKGIVHKSGSMREA